MKPLVIARSRRIIPAGFVFARTRLAAGTLDAGRNRFVPSLDEGENFFEKFSLSDLTSFTL